MVVAVIVVVVVAVVVAVVATVIAIVVVLAVIVVIVVEVVAVPVLAVVVLVAAVVVVGAGWLCQYSVWLRAGRPGDWGSIPGGGKRIFPVASVSRPVLGPTQHPV
jgi:hypothetical protein